MKTIKDSGDRTQFETGAVRDMGKGKGRMDLLPHRALIRVSKHYEAGADKYGAHNWEQGIPSHSFLDSALRHLAKYADGWHDEDHLAAAAFNVLGLIYNEEYKNVPKIAKCLDVPKQTLADIDPEYAEALKKIQEAGYER